MKNKKRIQSKKSHSNTNQWFKIIQIVGWTLASLMMALATVSKILGIIDTASDPNPDVLFIPSMLYQLDPLLICLFYVFAYCALMCTLVQKYNFKSSKITLPIISSLFILAIVLRVVAFIVKFDQLDEIYFKFGSIRFDDTYMLPIYPLLDVVSWIPLLLVAVKYIFPDIYTKHKVKSLISTCATGFCLLMVTVFTIVLLVINMNEIEVSTDLDAALILFLPIFSGLFAIAWTWMMSLHYYRTKLDCIMPACITSLVGIFFVVTFVIAFVTQDANILIIFLGIVAPVTLWAFNFTTLYDSIKVFRNPKAYI